MIEVAAALLQEGGSPALTVRAVAERTGVSVGTVYASFDHLESLKLEANAVTMAALRSHLGDASRHLPQAAEPRLLGLAHAYLAFAQEHHRPWAALFDQTTVETPASLTSEITALFAIIEQALAGVDGLPTASVPMVAKALWSSVHGMIYLGELGGLGPVGREDVPAMIDTLVRAALRGLSAR